MFKPNFIAKLFVFLLLIGGFYYVTTYDEPVAVGQSVSLWFPSTNDDPEYVIGVNGGDGCAEWSSNVLTSTGSGCGSGSGSWATSSSDYWAQNDLILTEISDVDGSQSANDLIYWDGDSWANTATTSWDTDTTCDGSSCNVTNTGTLDGLEGSAFFTEAEYIASTSNPYLTTLASLSLPVTQVSGISGGVGITYSSGAITFDCSEVEGTGIDCATEAITLDATGDWTGTLDSVEGAAFFTEAEYIASTSNPYITTMANLSITESQISDLSHNAWATTSTDYWETQQTARTVDDLSDDDIDALQNVAAMTEAEGDILYYLNGAWNRLASSTDGLVLELSDGYPSWQTDNTAGSPAWGDITGTLSNQTDLQAELDAKIGTSTDNFVRVCDEASCDYVTDGTADDVQIQAALTAGNYVQLECGTYDITAPLVVSDNDVLQGRGVCTALNLANSVNDNVIASQGTGFTFFVILRDFRINGNDANNTTSNGIYADKAHSWWIENLHIDNMNNDGIQIVGDGSNIALNTKILNSRIEDSGEDAIEIGDFAPNNHIRGNIVDAAQNNGYGMNIKNTETVIVGNHFHECGTHCLYFAGAGDNNLVISNFMETSGSDFGTGGSGIYGVAAASGNRIVGNVIFNHDDYGIEIYGNGWVVANNKAFDRQGTPTQDYGLYIGAGAEGTIVTGNDFSDNVTGTINDLGTNSSLWMNGTTTPNTIVNTATSTFTGNIDIDGDFELFGVFGDAWTDFCTSITGGAGLCDGTDDTGGAGVWTDQGDYLDPTNGEGIIVSASSTIDADLTITGTTTIAGQGTGGFGEYDLEVGNDNYSALHIGTLGLYSTNFSAASLDLDKAAVFRQEGSLGAGNDPGIEFAFMEQGNTIRMAIPESNAGNATAMIRSVTIAGPSANDNDIVLCSYWGFWNIDCDTGGTGADLGVQDDLQVLGNFTLGGTLTASSTLTLENLTTEGLLTNSTAGVISSTSTLSQNFIDAAIARDTELYTDADVSTYLTGGVGITEAAGTISFDCSEVEGVGINCATEAITLDATGNWTGTLDSIDGADFFTEAEYIASTTNPYITTMANLSLPAGQVTGLNYYTDADVSTYLTDGTGINEASGALSIDFTDFDTDSITQGATNLFNQTHSSEVTGATALTIASGVVDSDNISNNTILGVDLSTTTTLTDSECLVYVAATDNFTSGACSGGSSPWTNGSGVTYLTDIAEDLAVGNSAITTAPFWVDVSATTTGIGNGGTGDAVTQFGADAFAWTIGLDDDQSDEFVIASSTSLGTNNVLSIAKTLLATFEQGLAVLIQLILPNGTAPTQDTVGQIALDTSDDQLVVHDGTASRVFAREQHKLFQVTVASTSVEFVSGGVIPIPPERDGYEMTEFHCYVDGGTSVVLNVSDGTNDTETITCLTTITTDTDVATNDTATAGELMELQVGTITGTPDYVSFTAYGHITRE